tara:strand:- start:235 stop:498 length:264 start_codon:yes stop_codon:yes gene_type:complete
MDKITQLMVITMEECGELIQVCSKVLRKRATQGKIPAETLDKLEGEVADVLCMVELMKENKLIFDDGIEAGIERKRNKLKTWSDLIE